MLPAAVQFILNEEAAAADENAALQGPFRVLQNRLDPLKYVPDNFSVLAINNVIPVIAGLNDTLIISFLLTAPSTKAFNSSEE